MQPTHYLSIWLHLHKYTLGLALLVTAALILSLPADVRADVIIGGCTIVSNPTAAHFTNCPGAALDDADLSGGMNLSFAKLNGASLKRADISDATLNDADLSGSSLNDADVSGASLLRTNLSNANLTGTDISLSNLSGATLSNVIWNNTLCPDETNSNSHSNTCVGHLLLPTITATATKADTSPYTAGQWTNQNVTIHFACVAAAGHTLATCTADQTFTTDGNFTKDGTATDSAGFFNTVSFGPIQIDKSKPTITASATKVDNTPYTPGSWSNQNVTIHFTCNDSGSGLAGTCPVDQVISTEGVTSVVNGTVTDNAGNSANASFGPIQIDKTKPTITGNRLPAANSNGWNSSDVTVSFTCTDNQNGSGLATNTVAGATVSSEGANQAVTNSGLCNDNAGNGADAVTINQIHIDKSAPDTTISSQPDDPSPLIATFGFSGDDALSGVVGFQCSLDGASFTGCTSPQHYSTLTEGQHTFQVRAIDGADHLDATPASYTWTASGDLPVAADQTVTTAEESALAITLQATGKNTVTYSLVGNPAHGTLSGVAPDLIYTPTTNFYGVDSFTFRANDGQFNSNVARVTINVTPVDDAPIVHPSSLTLVEDTPISFTLDVQEVDGDVLTYAVLRQPTHGALRGALPNITYTPAANFNGNDTLIFSVADSAGPQASRMPATVITGTVSMTISAVNDAPVAIDQTVTTPPGAPLALTLSASDVEADPLTYTLVATPQHGTLSGTAPNLLYTPSNNFTGNDQLTFQANDGQVASNAATITIRVTDRPFDLFLALIKR